MAKVLFGALAQDVRGSLAGTVFGKGRGGAYARQKVSPTQPQTVRQLAQRAIFSAASQAWRALTDDQRAAWNTWASSHTVVDVFGASHVLSGIAAFTRINAMLGTAGLAAALDPVADVTPGSNVDHATAVGATGIVTLTFTTQPGIGDVFVVYTTAGISPGAEPQKAQFRIAGIVTGAAATLAYTVTPTDLNPKLTFGAGDKFGLLVDAIGTNGLVQSTIKANIIAT